MDITIPKSDFGFSLNFTVQEDDETAFNLTGYTITMKVWSQGLSSDPIVTGACVADVEASGTCHYPVVQYDFDDVGDYLVEIELTKVGVAAESTRNYTLHVEESA